MAAAVSVVMGRAVAADNVAGVAAVVAVLAVAAAVTADPSK